jgi:indolepyruvate ferredoxin oxidoreductase
VHGGTPMTAEARIDAQYRLEDRYTRDHGRVFLTGIQALVRLPLVQRRIDVARGHHTAGLVSGYRGSPGGRRTTRRIWRARSHWLDEHHVRFEPGINEDLGATTAVWGSAAPDGLPVRRGPLRRGVRHVVRQGARGGPLRATCSSHANMAGTAPLGGVLALAGDDHNASSSIFPHQTDGILTSCLIPVLNPASVAELLEFGLAGIALSRYSGLWVGMKTIAEVVEAGGVVDLDALQTDFRGRADAPALPQDHTLNWDPTIAWPAQRWEFERRLLEERIPAVRAFTRANGLDRIVWHSPRPRFGIVTVGKAHQDLLQALATVGLDEARAGELGLTIYKVGVSWPLEEQGIHAFADGLERLLVVEEKQPLVEDQLKAQLYRARPTSAQAARTTPRRGCPKERRRSPASAAISWRAGWTATRPR